MSRTKLTCLFEQFSLYELTFDVELGPRFVSFKLESELDQSLSLVYPVLCSHVLASRLHLSDLGCAREWDVCVCVCVKCPYWLRICFVSLYGFGHLMGYLLRVR